ncbi:hypothetical protein [Haladaptatus sp. T7]|uniref:hypothetical protein n=1 Tax=Haladaptatus sp. T7 TaxID=2029368 RepID=UPI0021A2517F|nr:hypothetical protein [Haladaptatus sp. T7]GKZ13029.1 hypothetical protein HAL_09100 [Haladaptatus sp. T7]
MNHSLRRFSLGLYVLWLLATVLLVLGKYTSFPTVAGVHSAVVVGAAVLTVGGAGRLARDGYQRFVA